MALEEEFQLDHEGNVEQSKGTEEARGPEGGGVREQSKPACPCGPLLVSP